MVNNRGFIIVIMIWVTLLTVWAVNSVTSIMSNLNSVHVSGIPHPHPIEQPISTVRIDENTVWVIDANSSYIKVITQDEDGFKVTDIEMQYTR